MKQMRLPLKPRYVILGILCIGYYTVQTLYFCRKCSFLFDIGKYENTTYFLQRSESEPLLARNLLPETDYKNLIDMSFTFTIGNSVCDNIKPLLLILIHSAPKNFEKRNVIRETWGRSMDSIKILFILGTPDDIVTKYKLNDENYLHKDLLQGNFLDSYRNMTYKHVMGFKFVVYHCSQARYVLKVDDDTCINIPLLINFLRRDLSPYGAEKLLMCNVVHKANVFRNFRSKWRVTYEEYQQRYFPTYCSGWYILYSPDVIFRLYKEVQRTKYFWIDDVHVTGLIAAKLNFVSHTDLSALTFSREEKRSIHYVITHKRRPFLFGWADMKEYEIRFLWEYILDNPVPESVTETLIVTDCFTYQKFVRAGLK